MILFQKVHCKAFMKPVKDGIRIEMYNADGMLCTDKIMNDGCGKACAYKYGSGSEPELIADLSDFCGDTVEKTYYERKEREFDGFVVGYKELTVKALLGTDWCCGHYGRDYGYCFKDSIEHPKVAIVYFRNNCKRYVLLEDMEGVEECVNGRKKHQLKEL